MTALPSLTLDEVLAAMPTASDRFSEALTTLARYESEPVILKTELADLRQALNRGFERTWTIFIREPFFHNGRWQSLSEADQKLERTLGLYPEVHTAAGYKRRVLASKAETRLCDTMIDVLNVLIPIAERAEALKTKVGKRAAKVTKTSIARDERDAKTMTCQCCARPILAETGVIAHHGYQRPAGMGYQTASCPGAREVPFEVSRDALDAYIRALYHYLERRGAALAAVRAEASELAWTYFDRTGCTQPWQRGREVTVPVTRATLPAEIEKAQALGSKAAPTFDQLKQRAIGEIEADIRATEREVDHQNARFDTWKQTHKRDGGRWVAVAA